MRKSKTFLRAIKGGALLLVFCAAFIAIRAQTISLQLQSDNTTGVASGSPIMSVGDVNNDGLPDLVVLNKSNSTAAGPIAIFLNNGNGGFASPINIPDSTGLSPNVAIVGDLNKDGFPDLAIANDGIGNGVNIRLGNGTGNFPTGTYLTAERGIFAMVEADLNGDGNLDLAGFGNSNDLRVYFGTGTGGFSAATPYTIPSPGDIIVTDLNSDGKPDLAIAASFTILTLLNNGTGVFTAGPSTTGVGQTNRLITADFNRDCIPDLAITGSAANNARVLLGNGSGGFTSQATFTMPNGPSDLAVGDFNLDKKVDVAIRSASSSTTVPNFTIFPGNGAGGFGTAFELTLPIAGQNTFSQQVATMDVNRDGKADILIGRRGGFFVYNGNSPLFTRTENDFDGDLRADLSVYRPSNGTWYLNRSTKGFTSTQWGLATDKPAAADYDGDGKTDIAIWREAAFARFWILRSSDSTLQLDQFGQTGDDPTVVGDWDGDGKADPAVYRDSAFGNQGFFFYRGSLNNPTGTVSYQAWGTTGDKAARGDFDGDGKQDAAVFRASDALWYIRQSSNNVARSQSWGVATDRRVSGDFDGDGKTDLAVFRPSEGLWYILNSATNTVTYTRLGLSTDTLVTGDYNGDGKTEAAVYRPSDGRWYSAPCAGFNQNGTAYGSAADIAVPSTLNPAPPPAAPLAVVASGLHNPRGLNFAPDGSLYVAEAAGNGTPVAASSCALVSDGTTKCFSRTGSVTKINIGTGAAERVISNLPSLISANGDASAGLGTHDVSFDGANSAYITIGLGANPGQRTSSFGADGTSLARLAQFNGSFQVTVGADLGNYETVSDPDGHATPDSNPYGLVALPGKVIYADSGGNAVNQVLSNGQISTLAVFPNRNITLANGSTASVQAVPTTVALASNGDLYVGELTGAPFTFGTANIWRVPAGSSTPVVAYTGFTNVIDIAFAADGSLYVLEVSRNGIPAFNPGRLVRIEPNGRRAEIAAGQLNSPGGIAVGSDGALYITNRSVSPTLGEVVRVPPAITGSILEESTAVDPSPTNSENGLPVLFPHFSGFGGFERAK